MRIVVGALAILAVVGVVFGANNWVYLVEYSAEGCPTDRWTTYTSTKIAGGCSSYPNLFGARYLKYDCGTMTGMLCRDDKCTTQCEEIGAVDYSTRKDCTRGGQTSPRWYRAFCGDVSSPFVNAPQIQLRTYGFGNGSCTTPMVSATGYPAEQCFAGAGEWSKWSCKDNTVTFSNQCDSTCNTCASSITQTITQCILGATTGCGVGAASSIVLSMSALALSVILSLMML